MGYNQEADKAALRQWANMLGGVKDGASSAWGSIGDFYNTIPSPRDNIRAMDVNARMREAQGGSTKQAGPMVGATDSTPPTQQAVTATTEQPPIPPPIPPPAMTSNTPNPLSFDLGGKADDSDIKALLDQINAQGEAAVGDQRGSLKEKEQMLRDYMQTISPQVDISPLMALADSWYGGELSQGYTKPMSGADVFNGSHNLQGGIDKARLGVSDTESDKLKQELMGRMKLREIQAMEVNKKLMRATTQDLANKNYDFKVNRAKEANREKFDKIYTPTVNTVSNIAASTKKVREVLAGKNEMSKEDLAYITSAASQLAINYNKVAELGALAAQDLPLLENTIGLATSMKGLVWGSVLGKDVNYIRQKMDELDQANAQAQEIGRAHV